MSDTAEAADGDGAGGGEPVASHGVPNEGGFRAGERALNLLATPINLSILRALVERPLRLADLRRTAGLPAQTTLRAHLRTLGEIGAVSRDSAKENPHTVENALTPMGRELLEVAAQLETWLSRSPDGAISLHSEAAKGIVKAFIDGWGSTIMSVLAGKPMSLTELDSQIAEFSYPSLERRLSSMRMANLIEPRPSRGTRIPYAVTEWARRGVVPLAAASRCERLNMAERAAPVTQTDIEAAFMLATPLVRRDDDASGTCQLEVEAAPGGLRSQAGVMVTVEDGEVVACEIGVRAEPPASAVGSTADWFTAILDGKPELLRFAGDRRFAEDLVLGLHRALIAD